MIAEKAGMVVEIAELSRRFGRTVALDGVSLDVPRGVVFGLVGENGAGKTTLIKHILGLLKAKTGTVRVFGLDPVREPVGVLARVGYLSEDRDLPDWMRIDELLRYLRAFYPTWDDDFAEDLRRQFDLDPGARIKTLSQGQRARAGLLAAPGVPARAPGPRRAIDGARPDRAPRDPGGDHPHDRRGGADRPVLVALARRGRARLGPRRLDRSRQDRALRPARCDQGRPPAADAPVRRTVVATASASWHVRGGKESATSGRRSAGARSRRSRDGWPASVRGSSRSIRRRSTRSSSPGSDRNSPPVWRVKTMRTPALAIGWAIWCQNRRVSSPAPWRSW